LTSSNVRHVDSITRTKSHFESPTRCCRISQPCRNTLLGLGIINKYGNDIRTFFVSLAQGNQIKYRMMRIVPH